MKAVVIGGTSGLGRGISEELLARDYEVTTVSRSPTGLEGCLHFSCDIGDSTSLEKTLDDLSNQHRVIDCLACVVGFEGDINGLHDFIAKDDATISRREAEFDKFLDEKGKNKEFFEGIRKALAENPIIEEPRGSWRTLSQLSSKDQFAFAVGYMLDHGGRMLVWKRICDEAFSRNSSYVTSTLVKLYTALQNSEDPRVITIGSRWAFRFDHTILLPYSIAKRFLIIDMGWLKELLPAKINYYVVPPMDTHSYWRAREKIMSSPNEELKRMYLEDTPTNPKIIAGKLVEHALTTDKSGEILVIKRDGALEIYEEYDSPLGLHIANRIAKKTEPPWLSDCKAVVHNLILS